MKKATIPGALREQVWILYCGDKYFKHKCHVTWCENIMTPFMFEVGHNVPESKGGTLDIDNLRPICAKCNRSMGDHYTIDEFSRLSKRTSNLWECFKFTQKSSAAHQV
jgi:5-methylcytosine-specific restriction endonuclease McrA